jgi:predicted ribosomally synthesized peptide with SipW-like signal peptide
MKTRILMSVLAIGLSIALIGGATMAWFTDEADVPEATFTAGTVEIDVGGPFDGEMEDFVAENVNPGDSYDVTWNITNNGTKNAQIRISLESIWESITSDPDLRDRLLSDYSCADDEELLAKLNSEDLDTVPGIVINGLGTIWKEVTEAGQKWLYYYDESKPEGERHFGVGDTVTLSLTVTFDGPDMDNKYMGATYKIWGNVEAVQASNDAPYHQWGTEVFGTPDSDS